MSAAPLPVTGIDTHAHLFHRGLPLAAVRRYTLDYDATEADYLAHLAGAGLSHGVLVQPSFLGTDNGFMREVLRRHPDRLRGIAAVDPEISDTELDAMARDGVVGIRLNLIGQSIPDCRSAPWDGLFRKLAARDWVVEIHREAADLPQLLPQIAGFGLRVVADHFGRPDPALKAADPGFLRLLDLAGSGSVWVKISAPYRSAAGPEDAALMSAMLLDAFGPERLLWGSDWPHTQFETRANYESEFAALDHRVPGAVERHRILVDTPAKLYAFV